MFEALFQSCLEQLVLLKGVHNEVVILSPQVIESRDEAHTVFVCVEVIHIGLANATYLFGHEVGDFGQSRRHSVVKFVHLK